MRRRDPLAKEHFLEGNRQKWLVVLLALAGGVLVADMWAGVEPTPYLTFLTVIGPAFILGMAWNANSKIQKAPPPEPEPEDR